jgi:hypothetical protein
MRRLSLCRVSSSRRVTISSSHRPLTAPPSRRLIAQAGCCVASRRAAISSSRHAALLSSRLTLTVPPSRHLIAQAGCCVASRRAAISSSHRSLTAPPSRCRVPAGCCLASRCAALSSSRCAALSSSHCAPANCCVGSIKQCRRHQMPPRLCCRYRCISCWRWQCHHRC